MPKVKEGFSWKHQGNINVPVEEVSFSAGEDVQKPRARRRLILV